MPIQQGIRSSYRLSVHDHSTLPQGGLIASVLASITDPAHDHSSVAQGGIFPDLWLGASPLIRQASGEITFQTDEGTDKETIVGIKGKGNLGGILKIHDQDEAGWIEIKSDLSHAQISAAGTTPGNLLLQRYVNTNIILWQNLSSGNPIMQMYGYKTAVGAKYGRITVNANGILIIKGEDGLDVAGSAGKLGFYGLATPIVKPTGVPVTEAGIHAALVSLGLIAA